MSERERSESLGPSLRYLQQDFGEEAMRMAQLTHENPENFKPLDGSDRWPIDDPANPNFYDIKEAMTCSDISKGYGKTCPRDGEQNCSMVDALDEEGLAGQATLFQSWLWAYTVAMMLQVWKGLNEDAGSTCIWVCFCCNNVRASRLTRHCGS